jgi:hypothetical protein
MSVSNILFQNGPNHYNLSANSQTLNEVSANPTAADNTLWVNSSDSDSLYLGPNKVGGSGGVDELSELLDVSLTTLVNDQALMWDASLGKWTNMSVGLSPITHNVYVSVAGNDTTGNGSAILPYLTIAHAFSTITTASASQFYNVIIGPGIWTETVTIKAFCGIMGSGQLTRLVNGGTSINITDASWAVASPFCQVSNMFVGSISMTMSANPPASGTSNIYFNQVYGGSVTTIDATGSLASLNNVRIDFCEMQGSNFELTNIDLNMNNSDAGTIVMTNSLSSEIQNSTIGIFTLTNSPITLTNNSIGNLTTSGTFTITTDLISLPAISSQAIDPNTTLSITGPLNSGTYVPVITPFDGCTYTVGLSTYQAIGNICSVATSFLLDETTLTASVPSFSITVPIPSITPLSAAKVTGNLCSSYSTNIGNFLLTDQFILSFNSSTTSFICTSFNNFGQIYQYSFVFTYTLN